MTEDLILEIIDKLELDKTIRYEKISSFLRHVSYYKLAPYIKILDNNKYIVEQLPDCNDAWDALVLLYRYNIKLSIAIYPYIFILETTLKNQVNNLLCTSFGKNWYKDEELIIKAFNLDSFDLKLVDAFWQYKDLYHIQIEKIIDFYRKSIPDISDTQVTKRINRLKSYIYLIRPIREYIGKNATGELMDFFENETTFGYWVAIIKNKYFWNSNEIKLESLFIKPEADKLLINRKIIIKKLDSIRILRNYISHYKQIICCNIYEGQGYGFNLFEVYNNILELSGLLGIENVNELIGDLQCPGDMDFNCQGCTFVSLYDCFKVLHEIN